MAWTKAQCREDEASERAEMECARRLANEREARWMGHVTSAKWMDTEDWRRRRRAYERERLRKLR